MTEKSHLLEALLDRARRRNLALRIAEQSGLALGAAMAGAVLLMLAGTQILDWYWLVILFAGSLGFGLWRVFRDLPSRYVLAQQIDHTLDCKDTVSTAYHFENSRRTINPELLALQRNQAESVVRSVNLTTVFPFTMPKALYAAGGLAAVALGIFALRYGVTRSLDLRPSLVRIAYDTFFPNPQTANVKKSDWQKKIESELEKLGISVTDPKASDLDPNKDPLSAQNSPDITNSGESDSAKSKASSAQNEQESGEPGGDEKSDKSSAQGSDKGANDQPPEGNDGNPQNGQQTPNAKGGKESQGQNSSLLDKMRDAMSNMMSKLKTGSKPGDSKQSSQQDSKNASQSQQQGKGEKSQMAGKQQSNGSDQQDPQGQEQSQNEQSQNAKGKSGDRNADQKASQDAKSGIGKQDGDKSAREAEQLDAMGKISEIMGKRAKDMAGEVMVEVSGGKQQLKTQYSSKSAAHAEAGGEINRDEVPIEYHEYVQQYFEQIRKTPPPAAAPAKK